MSGNSLFSLCVSAILIAQLAGCVDIPEDVLPPPLVDGDHTPPDAGGALDAGALVEDAGPSTVDLCINAVDHPYFEGAGDGAEVAIQDLQDLALACVRDDCLDAVVADEGAAQCTTSCLEGKAPAELSGACLDCFVEEALCFFDMCAVECIAGDPELCFACQDEFCTPSFADCTGLP